jgi:hypothetical protein
LVINGLLHVTLHPGLQNLAYLLSYAAVSPESMRLRRNNQAA